jgi:hypothetical protein
MRHQDKQKIFLARINDEDSMRRSDNLLSDILGKRAGPTKLGAEVPNLSQQLSDGISPFPPIQKSQQDLSIRPFSLRPLKNTSNVKGMHLDSSSPSREPVSNPVGSKMNKVADSNAHQYSRIKEFDLKTKPLEFVTTMDDTDSLNNHFMARNQKQPQEPRTRGQEGEPPGFGEHAMVRLNTVVSQNQEINQHFEEANEELAGPQRSMTNGFKREKKKTLVQRIQVLSPTNQGRLEGAFGKHAISSMEGTSPGNLIAEKIVVFNRNDTFSEDNDSKSERSRSSESDKKSSASDPQDGGYNMPTTNEARESRSGNGPKEIAVLSSGELKGILRNKNYEVKKPKSVYEMAMSAVSGRSKVGKGKKQGQQDKGPGSNAAKKVVAFSGTNEVHEVESWKKYNGPDYEQTQDPKKCCGLCQLI